MINFKVHPPLINTHSDLMLEGLKGNLKIIGSAQDDVLKGWLDLAIELCEKYTWRILRECVVDAEFSSISESRIVKTKSMLDFRRAPFNDIIVVKFRAKTGDEDLQAHYAICSEFAEIYIDSEPTTSEFVAEYPLFVSANCGYKIIGGVWLCPESIVKAVIMLAGYMYINPLECNSSGCSGAGGKSNDIGLPVNVAVLLNPYVIRRFDGNVCI